MTRVSETLDVFRGLAAVAMVINHAGFALLEPASAASGLTGLLVFLGSLAPALFFLATGLGVGLRPKSQGVFDWRRQWTKVAWLLLADQFLMWSSGRYWGMDFFGFIALSSIVVAWLGTRNQPVRWAVGLMAGLLILRYGLRSPILSVFGEHGVIVWVSGVVGQSGWSYPLSPWLVAPLAGYLMGQGVLQLTPVLRRRIWLALVLLCGGLATGLLLKGASFFRWGSVSIAYFLAAVALTALAWALAGALVTAAPTARRWLSMRGTSAFLVVPLHYAMLAVLKGVVTPPLPDGVAVAWMGVVTAMAVVGALRMSTTLEAWRMVRETSARSTLLLVLLAAGLLLPQGLALVLVCCCGQIVVAAQFSRR